MADPESTVLAEPALAPAAEALVLGEGALATPAAGEAALPSSWAPVTIGVVSGKLDWTRARDLIGQLPPGAVGLLPSSSGFVKVLTAETPETSEYFVQSDTTMYAEPGSVEALYKNAQGPADPLDQVHFALDVIGLAPVFGGAADLANAVLYFIHGDAFNGSMSMIGILPGLGEAATVARYGDDVVEFGSRSLLREGLLKAGKVKRGEQAHHLIPWQLRLHPVVQAAARNGFDMNHMINGIALPTWRIIQVPLEQDLDSVGRLVVTSTLEVVEGIHACHPAANFYVLKRLEEIAANIGASGAIDPMLARQSLEVLLERELRPELTALVTGNVVINDHFRALLRARGWDAEYAAYLVDATTYYFIRGTRKPPVP